MPEVRRAINFLLILRADFQHGLSLQGLLEFHRNLRIISFAAIADAEFRDVGYLEGELPLAVGPLIRHYRIAVFRLNGKLIGLLAGGLHIADARAVQRNAAADYVELQPSAAHGLVQFGHGSKILRPGRSGLGQNRRRHQQIFVLIKHSRRRYLNIAFSRRRLAGRID